MIKKIFILLIINILFFINTSTALAEVGVGDSCGLSHPSDPNEPCVKGYCCLLDQQAANPDIKTYSCQDSPACAFGKIQAPAPLAGFLKDNPTGAEAISKFLSNFVVLIYTAAAIVLIFMLLWGAFDWMVSGGDKEAVAKARNKIMNAFIGILLFAVAFAVLQVLGQFTGFTFFVAPK